MIFDGFLGDIRISVDTSYPIERDMLTGTYMPEFQTLLKQMVSDGDICIDIGANVGAITMSLAKYCGSGGMVIAFEPGPPTFSKLKKNIALNPQLEQITSCYQLGLSDQNGTLCWEEESHNPGNATLLSDQGTSVPVTTLDAFLETSQLSSIDFIKIDVEGMEYEVMKGAKKTLEQFHPSLFFETHRHFETVRDKPLLELIEKFLTECGYLLYTLDAGLKPINSIYESNSDAVAIHQSKVYALPERH